MSPETANLSQLSVAALAERLRADPSEGSADVCIELLNRFRPLLHRAWLGIAREVYPSVEEEDFVQSVILRLLGSVRALRDPKAFPGYLKEIVRAVREDTRRRAGVKALVELGDLAAMEEGTHSALVVDSYLRLLSEKEANILRAVLFEDRSSVDAAKSFGLTAAAFRSEKSRAIKHLRQLLRRDAAALIKNRGR